MQLRLGETRFMYLSSTYLPKKAPFEVSKAHFIVVRLYGIVTKRCFIGFITQSNGGAK